MPLHWFRMSPRNSPHKYAAEIPANPEDGRTAFTECKIVQLFVKQPDRILQFTFAKRNSHLFVPQCLDWIHLSSLPRGKITEHDADERREGEREQNNARINR